MSTKCRSLKALPWVIIALWLGFPFSANAVRVIEEGAIPFTGFLSKPEFDERFPGELVEELSELEPGWYVIYEHEALSYYFGPILLESTGRDYLLQLESIVAEAVAKRPAIKNYRLELSFEPSTVAGEGAVNEPENSSEDEEGIAPEASEPPAAMSIWGFFKRLFGF